MCNLISQDIVQAIVDEMGEHYDVPRVSKALPALSSWGTVNSKTMQLPSKIANGAVCAGGSSLVAVEVRLGQLPFRT